MRQIKDRLNWISHLINVWFSGAEFLRTGLCLIGVWTEQTDDENVIGDVLLRSFAMCVCVIDKEIND